MIRAGALLLALAVPQAGLAAQAVTLQAPYAAAIQQAVKVDAGQAGVSIIDLKSGQKFSVNGGERFPMASVVKVGVAADLHHEQFMACANSRRFGKCREVAFRAPHEAHRFHRKLIRIFVLTSSLV